MAARLQAGVNRVVVKVYNQRSYTGGPPFIGGHLPEGCEIANVVRGPWRCP